ncbi:MAG: GNAT family N-acetyltransferase [Deltaproteobacteria bacterium]|nr:GNAT family N-acetyltransferase [Deltaproteobacteria bacterium]
MPHVLTAEAAVKKIPKGCRIFLGSGAAHPLAISDAMAEHYAHFSDNELIHLMTLGHAAFVGEKFRGHLRDNSFFIGDNVRTAVQSGEADYTPIFLSEIPGLFRSGSFPIAVAIIMVAPPDQHGMCSLGVSVDVVRAAVEAAELVIAQVNPQMPRTFGQALLPYGEIDYVVEADLPLPEIAPPVEDAVIAAIGKNVAKLIPDGAVVQMGIGGIPNAVLANLRDKNDLGIHTEMFSDGVIDLIRAGNITNATKKVLKGRTATSFCFGSRRLYDFVHENPLIEFYPSDFINDPFCIAQNDGMVAVNSALQIDLTGQVCADSIGYKFYSGIGGQVDFVRGAARSVGGKPIIALPSTAKGGAVSRIVGELSRGAGVVTSRGDIHYVVTEYGIASLHGKSIRQRATSLIHIAHPDFRDELLSFVKERHYVYIDQRCERETTRFSGFAEEQRAFGGHQMRVRSLKITDERRLQEFFYSHSEDTIRQRYFHLKTTMPREIAARLVQLDYDRNMALVVLEPGRYDDRIVAIARYAGAPGADTVELSFVVHEAYQRQGMGGYLCGRLVEYARRCGIRELLANCLASNLGMRAIFDRLQPQVSALTTTTEGDILRYRFTL